MEDPKFEVEGVITWVNSQSNTAAVYFRTGSAMIHDATGLKFGDKVKATVVAKQGGKMIATQIEKLE